MQRWGGSIPSAKCTKRFPYKGQHEVIGMSGDIALYQGKPVVHTHMIVGYPDGSTREKAMFSVRPCPRRWK